MIKSLVQQGATTFYLGDYGSFVCLAATVLGELNEQYPLVERVLILVYLNTGRNFSGYDSVPSFLLSKRSLSVLPSPIETVGWWMYPMWW